MKKQTDTERLKALEDKAAAVRVKIAAKSLRASDEKYHRLVAGSKAIARIMDNDFGPFDANKRALFTEVFRLLTDEADRMVTARASEQAVK